MTGDPEHDPGAPPLACPSLTAAPPVLRRPPVPEVVRFKLQTIASDSAQVAAYVDARFVYDRLDLVCGGRWSAGFAPLPKQLWPRPLSDTESAPLYVRCRLTVLGVSREDVGEGADPKAAYSDAAKRAAVQFGVARALYALRLPWLRAGRRESSPTEHPTCGHVATDRRRIPPRSVRIQRGQWRPAQHDARSTYRPRLCGGERLR